MRADHNWNSIAGLRWLILVLIVFRSGAALCDALPMNDRFSITDTTRTVNRSGYVIEIFDSAEDQLRYARARFSDPWEKQAALEVLIRQYPEPNTVRAEAEMELAYLALGADYRFADAAACQNAVGKYRQIAAQYADLPAIGAKAFWYMGWIYADLLGQKQMAVIQYQTIVDRYADATLKIEPPVPWVSLVLPQVTDKPHDDYERPVYAWRSMALLEIIRNSENDEQKWAAFEKLWSDDLKGVATGHALRLLLHESPVLVQKTAEYARYYVQAHLSSRPLADEIRAILTAAGLKLDPGVHQPVRGVP